MSSSSLALGKLRVPELTRSEFDAVPKTIGKSYNVIENNGTLTLVTIGEDGEYLFGGRYVDSLTDIDALDRGKIIFNNRVFNYESDVSDRVYIDPNFFHHFPSNGQSGYKAEYDVKNDPYVIREVNPDFDVENRKVLVLSNSIGVSGTRRFQGEDIDGQYKHAIGATGGETALWGFSGSTPAALDDASYHIPPNLYRRLSTSVRKFNELISSAPIGSPLINPAEGDITQQSYEYRLLVPFREAAMAGEPFTDIFYDFAHNARLTDRTGYGFAEVTEISNILSAVSVGANTELTLSSPFDIENYGVGHVEELNKWAGEIISVVGNVATIDFDSSNFDLVGFTGTLNYYDPRKWASVTAWFMKVFAMLDNEFGLETKIHFCTSPSIYTGKDGTTESADERLPDANRLLRAMAYKFSVPLMDWEKRMNVLSGDNPAWLKDLVHPSSKANKRAMGAVFLEYWTGGGYLPFIEDQFNYTDFGEIGGSMLYFDKDLNAYTPFDGLFEGDIIYSPVLDVNSLTDFTVSDATQVSMVSPPFNSENTHVIKKVGGANGSIIYNLPQEFPSLKVKFDLFIPDVENFTTDGDTKTFYDFCRLEQLGGTGGGRDQMNAQFECRFNSISRSNIFRLKDNANFITSEIGPNEFTPKSGQVHKIILEYRQESETGASDGVFVFFVDGLEIARIGGIHNDPINRVSFFNQSAASNVVGEIYIDNIEFLAGERKLVLANDVAQLILNSKGGATGTFNLQGGGTLEIVNGIVKVVT